jgi:RHS repeat-associated protein
LYDAWGNVRFASGSLPTNIGYTGQRLDNSTGLMYYRARYYAQGLGRFISADSIVPGAADGSVGGSVIGEIGGVSITARVISIAKDVIGRFLIIR